MRKNSRENERKKNKFRCDERKRWVRAKWDKNSKKDEKVRANEKFIAKILYA